MDQAYFQEIDAQIDRANARAFAAERRRRNLRTAVSVMAYIVVWVLHKLCWIAFATVWAWLAIVSVIEILRSV